MKLLSNPSLEVKGYFVFLNGEPLDNKIYRLKDLPHLYGENKSNRVVFSYTPLARKGVHEYGILVIAGNWQKELNRFSIHKARGEEAMHLWGSSTIMVFDFDERGGAIVKEAHPKHRESYKLDGYLSIYNRDVVNSVWLLKMRPPLKNTDIFEKNRGEPILYKWNEKLRNYNYLVWKREDLEEVELNLLEELRNLLK